MSATDDGGPAFPASEGNGCNTGVPGMSLRDYFAAKAMAALLTEPPWGKGSPSSVYVWGQDFKGPPDENKTAFVAYKIADAMLSARGAA